MKYHLAHSTSITEPFEGQFDIGLSPFYGRFHVFKHSKADEMKVSIAEVNVTSPERILCGHFLLCYDQVHRDPAITQHGSRADEHRSELGAPKRP